VREHTVKQQGMDWDRQHQAAEQLVQGRQVVHKHQRVELYYQVDKTVAHRVGMQCQDSKQLDRRSSSPL